MTINVAAWGDIQITDEELTNLTFDMSLRYAKLTTVYEQPVIQYVGKDVTRLSMQIKTQDANKMFELWNQRFDLVNNVQEFFLGGVSYGNFYLETTKVKIDQYEVLRTTDLSTIIPESMLATFIIDIQAVAENYPVI